MWKLKKGQPSFEVVDGPLAGHRFQPGQEYKTIPSGEKRRFEKIKKTTAPVKGKETGKHA